MGNENSKETLPDFPPDFNPHEESNIKEDDDVPGIPNELDLLRSGNNTDVILECGSRRYHLHSHILSQYSDVFRTLTDNLVDDENCIRITDIGPFALETTVQYVYSGELGNMAIGSLMKVYEAAEIYLIEPLIVKCGEVIKKKLNETNACDVLIFSDLRGTCLKDAVIKYLIDRKSFLLSEKWRRFCDLHPKLATEVHLAFIRSTQ